MVLYFCPSRGSVNSPYERALLNALSMLTLLLDFAAELELSSTHSPDRQTDCVVGVLQMTVPSQASTHCHEQSAAPLLELGAAELLDPGSEPGMTLEELTAETPEELTAVVADELPAETPLELPALVADELPAETPEEPPALVADELPAETPLELSAGCGSAPLPPSPPQEVIARAAQSAAGIRNVFLIAKLFLKDKFIIEI